MDLSPKLQRELDEFLRAWERGALSKLQDAACSLTIYTGEFDGKLALEFGAAILLNKPLLVVAFDGARIPTKMLAVVDEIVELESGSNPQTPENLEKIKAGIRRLMARCQK